MINSPDANNPLNKLSQFQEIRADILASLQGIEYAQGAAEFFAHFIKKYGDQELKLTSKTINTSRDWQ